MPKADQLKLHEAMIVALVRKRQYRANPEKLARWIAELDLYQRWKDDEHPPAWQVVRRAKRYPEFFFIDQTEQEMTVVVLRFHFPELGWGTKRHKLEPSL